MPDTNPASVLSAIVFVCRALQTALTKKFVDCTKEDTMMSVWIVRARQELCGTVCPGVAAQTLPIQDVQSSD